MSVPRRIYALWLQGEDKAPPLVQMCLRRWRRLNPGYELEVLDRADAERILDGFPLRCDQLSPQALSDVLRVELLRSRGGVWVDATAFPTRPLDTWLPRAASSGFFAFQGHLRPIDADSWFLAAAPGHPVPERWFAEIEAYWATPRRLIEFSGEWAANYHFDPASFFRPDDGFFGTPGRLPAPDAYPYYWLMYIFTHLLSTSDDFRSHWDEVEKMSGAECHAIQRECDRNPDVDDAELVAAGLTTCVQKLAFRNVHVIRWLRLDERFAEIDRSHGASFDTYGVFPSFSLKYSVVDRASAGLYGLAKSLVPTPLRSRAAHLLRR